MQLCWKAVVITLWSLIINKIKTIVVMLTEIFKVIPFYLSYVYAFPLPFVQNFKGIIFKSHSSSFIYALPNR